MAYIGGMNRFLRPFAPLMLLLSALPAAADPIPLTAISAYINGLTEVQTDFTQLNADGTMATGVLSIKRPGRMRFEYGPPDDNLVLASGGQVAVFDGKSNEPPEQFPLKRTPLNLILAAKVDLSVAKLVVGVTESEGMTHVIAQDPENPEYGTIELIFEPEPIALRQWIVTDDLGQKTSVTLGALRSDVQFGAAFFSIPAEVKNRVE